MTALRGDMAEARNLEVVEKGYSALDRDDIAGFLELCSGSRRISTRPRQWTLIETLLRTVAQLEARAVSRPSRMRSSPYANSSP